MHRPPFTEEVIDQIQKRRDEEQYNAMMRIGDASRLYRDIIRRTSAEEGLPSSYRLMLFHLAHMEPGVTQLALVKATHLKAPTVSITLQKMEADGLVIRKSNEKDLRQTLVYLSEKGKSINESIHTTFENSDQMALQGLSEAEQKQLCDLLDRVIDNLIVACNSEKGKVEH